MSLPCLYHIIIIIIIIGICVSFGNRSQRSEGDRDSFPGKTLSEWIERLGGSSLGGGKTVLAPLFAHQ